MNQDASSVFNDALEDPKTRSPEEEMFNNMELARLGELLSAIDEREGEILKLRYGLGTGEPMTLKSIGQRFGLTRERVRQMEQQALQKLYGILSAEFDEERPRTQSKPGRK